MLLHTIPTGCLHSGNSPPLSNKLEPMFLATFRTGYPRTPELNGLIQDGCLTHSWDSGAKILNICLATYLVWYPKGYYSWILKTDSFWKNTWENKDPKRIQFETFYNWKLGHFRKLVHTIGCVAVSLRYLEPSHTIVNTIQQAFEIKLKYTNWLPL